MREDMSQNTSPQPLLGDFTFEKRTFPGLEAFFASLEGKGFPQMNQYQRGDVLNKKLLQLLKDHQKRGFLLLETLDFIHQVHKKNLMERYTMADIELWLNQFSLLSKEDNAFYRSLIVGKRIPREDYQSIFPIGMGKVHKGSHLVTAHNSPDIDTIVASFWGWMDAFAARVSSGLHVWNVPGGPPASSVETKLLFHDILHPEVFHYLSKNRSQLALTSFDLMTQEGFVRKKKFEHALGLEGDREHHAVVLVDDEGYYLGDWRPFDVEGSRQVVMLLNLCLRFWETKVHMGLFEVFSQKEVSRSVLEKAIEEIGALSLESSDPVQEMALRQQKLLEGFLSKVLGIAEGLHVTFARFIEVVSLLEIVDFTVFWRHLEALKWSEIFDESGYLVENRPLIFFYLEKVVVGLNDLLRSFRMYLDTLDMAIKIKKEVYGHAPYALSYRTDLKEIENHMGAYPYLTVNIPGPKDKQIPVGVISATDLKRPFLGTVTLRDFCNREETKVPEYLEVISVIDHHKSSLNTASAPTAVIADAQSANAIVCQQAFLMHDAYSLGGMTEEDIDRQIQTLTREAPTPRHLRLLQRLYRKKEILCKKGPFYIDPTREFLEYLHYLYAILDDTDLLTKVSYRDVVSVAELVNRLKTLKLKQEVEVIDFDEIPRDERFVKKAATLLLRSEDLYSLYKMTSLEKEKVIAENFLKSAKEEPSDIFADTKVQNGCCRVGQTKMFAKNYPLFEKLSSKIRAFWYKTAEKVYEDSLEVDLHLHMISTIAGAEELFKGSSDKYPYQDQMWIGIPETDLAIEHLKLF
ncbi:MAG: hypothetical protein FJZ63_03635, partial [Chlamydiae bacterium]|nr:hypothetical protein [Chlamydiota bacterium]